MVKAPNQPRRGEVWWADLQAPRGSEPGYRRPVAIIQSGSFNRSSIKMVIVAVVINNLRLAEAPGNVRVSAAAASLTRESVINVSQLLTLDRAFVRERAGTLSRSRMEALDAGLRRVLGF